MRRRSSELDMSYFKIFLIYYASITITAVGSLFYTRYSCADGRRYLWSRFSSTHRGSSVVVHWLEHHYVQLSVREQMFVTDNLLTRLLFISYYTLSDRLSNILQLLGSHCMMNDSVNLLIDNLTNTCKTVL